MTNVVVVINGGLVEQVYCRNKNVEIEILDLDTQNMDEAERNEYRLAQIEKAKTYRALL